ncbi:MAG: peptidase M28, partial [Allosphingosinicella sp.]
MNKNRLIWLVTGLLAFSAPIAPASAATPHEIAGAVSQERLRAIVEKLVSFGTRHTLSSQTDP